jgi:MFS transporter, Spinster family, sphingosine-1-phosphate transporter
VQEKTYKVGKGASIGILVVLCLLQLSDWADRSILNISLQAIKETFKLTDAQAGMLPSLLQIGVAVFLIPAAVLSDRFARRKVIMVMSSIWSIFTIVTGLATQMWHLVIARFMVGSSEGGYQPAGQTWLGLTFRKEIRAWILGIFMMCVPLGVALGLFVGGALLNATHDWRTAFFVFGLPGLILAIIALFLPDYKAVKAEGEGTLSKAYFKQWGGLFKIKSYWLFIISTTFIYFMVFGIQAWAPSLVMRAYPDMNPLQVGSAMAGVGLLNLLAPIGGIVADRWQKRNKNGRPLFLIITTVLGFLALLASSLVVGKVPFPSYLPFYMLTVLFMALMTPLLSVLVHDVTPVAVRATAVGILLTIAQVGGGVLGPIVIGAVSDATGGGYQGIVNGMLWTIPVAALSLVTTLIMLKYYAADSSKITDSVLAER